MERTWSTDVPQHEGTRVLLQGWLHHFRRLSRVSFLLLRDARGVTQIVVDDPELVRTLEQLHRESVLELEGKVVAEPQAPGGCEVREPSVRVLSEARSAPPVELHTPVLKAQLPTQLDHAPVTLRHPTRRASFALASAALHGFRSTLRARGFVEIQTPKIVASATESGDRRGAHGRAGSGARARGLAG